jgi:integral membrane protein
MQFDIKSSLGRFRLVGTIEAISYLVLLALTVVKYIAKMPHIVRLPGMVHGVLFVFFCYTLLEVHLKLKWDIKKSALLFLASLLPFGYFWADKKEFG